MTMGNNTTVTQRRRPAKIETTDPALAAVLEQSLPLPGEEKQAVHAMPHVSRQAIVDALSVLPTFPEREKITQEVGDVFGFDLGVEKDHNQRPVIDPNTGKPKKKVRMVTGYKDRTPWVPAIDLAYEFPEDETKMILLGMTLKDNVLVHGHTGTGKTSLINQIAARLNYQVVRINFDAGITRAELAGEWIAMNGTMMYLWGQLPYALRMPGTIIILDEWDAMSPDCGMVLQRPLEKDDRKLVLLELGGEVIEMHEDNMIVATANTRGLGDDTALYSSGTRVQNYAQLNRFGMTLQLSYLPPEKEKAMLRKRFPDLKEKECEYLVKAIGKVRKAYESNEISVPLSPRDLINWAQKFLYLGDPMRAAKVCFLNRMPPEDAATIEQVIQRSFAPGTT